MYFTTEDAQGRIWVGTRNGLNLFDRESGTFKVFREDDGLPDHNIISILPDSRGNLWISTLMDYRILELTKTHILLPATTMM